MQNILPETPNPDLLFEGEPSIPKGETNSGAYLIDLEKFKFSDILADDNGTYKYKGSPVLPFYFTGDDTLKAHSIDNKWYVKKRCCRTYTNVEVSAEKVFIIHRIYRSHKFHKSFTNIVCRVKRSDQTNFMKYCLTMYDWEKDSEEVDILVKLPHGNASRPNSITTPYIRTSSSTLRSMEEHLPTGEIPNKVYSQALQKSGGPFTSKSLSEPKQVSLLNISLLLNRIKS